MRRVRFPASIAAVIGLLLCFVSTALGEIPLYLSFERQVPAEVRVDTLVPGINQVVIGDIDGDGSRDMIFDNGDCIATYSIQADSVTFLFNKDHSIAAAGYLDGDDKWDAVDCRFVDIDSETCVIAVVHLSSDDWQPSDTIVFGCFSGQQSKALNKAILADIDKDGIPELYVQYQYTVYRENPNDPFHPLIETFGPAWRYRFADSTLEQSPGFIPKRSYEYHHIYPGQDSTAVLVHTDIYRSDFQDGPEVYTQTGKVSFIEDNSIRAQASLECHDCCSVQYPGYLERDVRIEGYVIGELLANHNGPELLVGGTMSGHTAGVANGDCDTSWQGFIYYGLPAEGGVDTLAIVPVDPNRDLGPLFASEDFSDIVYTYVRGRILALDRETLNIVDSSQSMTDIVGGWPGEFTYFGTLADGGPEYLVIRNGNTFSFLTLDQSTSTDTTDTEPDQPLLPTTFAVGSPYPNPFNPTVSIPLALPVSARVTATVFNVIGQAVDVVDAGTVAAGNTDLTWDASQHPSGVYFIRVATEQNSKTVKAVLLK